MIRVVRRLTHITNPAVMVLGCLLSLLVNCQASAQDIVDSLGGMQRLEAIVEVSSTDGPTSELLIQTFSNQSNKLDSILPIVFFPTGFEPKTGDMFNTWIKRRIQSFNTSNGRNWICDTKLNDAAYQSMMNICLDANANAALRLSLACSLSKESAVDGLDRAVFALLMAERFKEKRFDVLESVLLSTPSFATYKHLITLARSLNHTSNDTSPVVRSLKLLRNNDFRPVFVLPRGAREPVVKSPFAFSEFTRSAELSEFDVMEMYRCTDIDSFPRVVRRELFHDIFSGLCKLADRLPDEEVSFVFFALKNDFGLLLTRMLQSDDITVLLESRVLYLELLDSFDRDIKSDPVLQSSEFASIFQLVDKVFISSGSYTANSRVEVYSEISKINEMARTWEKQILLEFENK